METVKVMGETRLCGQRKAAWQFTPELAAYGLVRMPKLPALPRLRPASPPSPCSARVRGRVLARR